MTRNVVLIRLCVLNADSVDRPFTTVRPRTVNECVTREYVRRIRLSGFFQTFANEKCFLGARDICYNSEITKSYDFDTIDIKRIDRYEISEEIYPRT